jgi:hypothetical protein
MAGSSPFQYLRVALAARAVVLRANWPYTIFVIMPTYHRPMNTPPGAATPKRAA